MRIENRTEKDKWLSAPYGTKVWYRPIKESGSRNAQLQDWLVSYVPIFHDDFIYVVDDQYAQLRKACYDGFDIEVYFNQKWIPIRTPQWTWPVDRYCITSASENEESAKLQYAV